MMCHDLVKIAEEWEIDRIYALRCRKKYLTRRLWDIEAEIRQWLDTPWTDAWVIAFFLIGIQELRHERYEARREIGMIGRLLLKQSDGRLTEEMVERARAVPVTELVTFTKGRAEAWCHADRHPSLYVGTRTNRVICPVCNKSWGPIDIIMEREGVGFREAVNKLVGGS